MTLGRLQRVDLRTVWDREDTDFTPWLSKPENLDALNDTLGMDLETIAMEQFVGPYRADILCKDSVTQDSVLIENQLEKTDHNHLGQILTYAAGLNVKTIIWIASRFTDEHRAAMDWLNEVTEEDFSFFGLELELWKIGDSQPAPKFNIVSRPNTWSKNIREVAQHSGEYSNVKQKQYLFWSGFREFMAERKSPIRCQKALPQHWMNMSIGRSGFWLTAKVNSQKSRIAADMHCKTATSKAVFHSLMSQKADIESEFGDKLEWHELPDNKESYITVVRENSDFLNEADWENQFEWLAQNLEKFDSVFRKRVRDLEIDE